MIPQKIVAARRGRRRRGPGRRAAESRHSRSTWARSDASIWAGAEDTALWRAAAATDRWSAQRGTAAPTLESAVPGPTPLCAPLQMPHGGQSRDHRLVAVRLSATFLPLTRPPPVTAQTRRSRRWRHSRLLYLRTASSRSEPAVAGQWTAAENKPPASCTGTNNKQGVGAAPPSVSRRGPPGGRAGAGAAPEAAGRGRPVPRGRAGG